MQKRRTRSLMRIKRFTKLNSMIYCLRNCCSVELCATPGSGRLRSGIRRALVDRSHLDGSPARSLMQINTHRLSPRHLNLSAGAATRRDRPTMLRPALRQTLATLILITPALAASPAEQRGKAFALNNCARCHSIDQVTQSPLKIAPPFRTLHLRYPVETLAEALAEGIVTGHPTMPAFQLDPDQINDLLSYLKTLE